MQRWEQWEAKKVTPEQNGTGEYSDAGNRARAYREGAYATCDIARLQAWQLQELAQLINDSEVTVALQPLDGFKCNRSSPSPIAGDSKERSTFQGDWQRRKDQAVAAASDGVDACFKKVGGTPPSVHVPTNFTQME